MIGGSYELYIFVKRVHINYIFLYGLMSRVFANGPGDLGSIPGRVISKTQKNGT